jgi:hypothetical protein
MQNFKNKLNMVAQAYNPSTQEAEARRLKFQGHPWLHNMSPKNKQMKPQKIKNNIINPLF